MYASFHTTVKMSQAVLSVLCLYGAGTSCWQRRAELLGMDELGQALQSLYQPRTRTPNEIRVEAEDVMRLYCCNAPPIRAFVNSIDVAPELRIFSEHDVLGIGADNRFVSHLWEPSP